MVKKSAKVPIVEGFKFRVQRINIERDYYPVVSWSGTGGHVDGPAEMTVEMSASSADFTKEDWGELMDALTAGETVAVIGRE